MLEQDGHEKDFVTFAWASVKHSMVHRPHIGMQVKADKESKEPRTVGPLDKTISVRGEGTTVQMWDRDGKVAGRWMYGYCTMEKSAETGSEYRRQYTRAGKTEWCTRHRQVATVRSTFTEHHQQADDMAKLAAEGTTKVAVEGFTSTSA